MSIKLTFLKILFVLLLINIGGFFLRYFEMDTHFILLGFRFHFSLIILLLVSLKYIDFSSVKEMFVHPSKQKVFSILLAAFLPLVFIPVDMFLLEEFKFSQKDYFFELGLSSIADYPVYLIWNAPQLFIFFSLINSLITKPGYKLYKAALLTFFLFLYEIIPVNIFDDAFSLLEINFITAADFILVALLSGLFISQIKNIYLFTLLLFTIMWGAVLFFGSDSAMIVNILLASQYDSWSGLINPGNKFEWSVYMHSAYLFLLFLYSAILFKRNNS